MEGSLRLIEDLEAGGVSQGNPTGLQTSEAHHFIGTSHKYRHSTSVRTLLYHEHFIPSGAERNFANDSCSTQFFCGEILKSRDDSPIGGNSDELRSKGCHEAILSRAGNTYLDLRTTDPAHSG